MLHNRRGEEHSHPVRLYLDSVPASWQCGICQAGSRSLRARVASNKARAYCAICGFPYVVTLPDDPAPISDKPTPALGILWREAWRLVFRQFPDGLAVRNFMAQYSTPSDAIADAKYVHPLKMRRSP